MIIKISADSTCDLGEELIKKHNISIIPLHVELGDRAFRDGVDITEQDIFDYVNQTGDLPKTAAPAHHDYQKAFDSLSGPGCGVIHISLGSKFSSSYQNAAAAAKDFEHVYVVDSMNLSTGHGHVVMQAADMAEKGLDLKTIIEKLEDIIPKVRASFIINQLDYLYKGGRCSGIAALGANLLKLKPSIIVHNGEMHVDKKYRGSFERVLEQYAEYLLSGDKKIRKDRVFITHTRCDDGVAQAVAEKVKSLYPFAKIHDTLAGSTITSHCGPNTLGILFIEE